MQEIINGTFKIGVIILVGTFIYYKHKKFGAHEGYGVYIPIALGSLCIAISALLQVVYCLIHYI